MFGKKNSTPTSPADRPAAPGADPPRGATGTAGTAAPAGVDGLLAGRVIDSYGSNPPKTAIRVVSLDEPQEPAAAPIEYQTDAQGYFTIFSLKAGHHYKLVARAPDNGRVLAGITYVTPPDPKVVIHISEDFNSPTTPAVPSEPTWPGSKPPGSKDGGKAAPKQPATNLGQPGTPGSVDLGTPRPNNGAATTQPSLVTPTHPENVVDGGNALARGGTKCDVPGLGGGAAMTAPSPSQAANAAPFCAVSTDRAVNFTLSDLDGRPWEFATRPHGRVVLLDFWGPWCPPCVRAIPELIQLEYQYGAWGLDIVGIAYQYEGTPEEQSRNLKGFRDRLGINYPILLGGGMQSCPLKTQLRVQNFPTLILLDEKGHELWRCEGLTPQKRQELEFKIRYYVNVQR
jgi:thiol-disulfide isomerase/thioredoxin